MKYELRSTAAVALFETVFEVGHETVFKKTRDFIRKLVVVTYDCFSRQQN